MKGAHRKSLWEKRHRVRAIQRVNKYNQAHQICKLAALTAKLEGKTHAPCPWNETQYKWNMTVAENCNDGRYHKAYYWLMAPYNASRPNPPKILSEAEYQLIVNPPGAPGLCKNISHVELKIKGKDKAIK